MSVRSFFPHEKPHVDDIEAPLAALEQKLGLRLPEEYRSFVAELGGAAPDGRLTFPVLDPAWKGGSFEVEAFYGLGAATGAHDLLASLDAFGDRIPAAMIPIAMSASGDQVCLAVRGDARGSVHVWSNDVFVVTKSFDAFLASLVFKPAEQIIVPSSFPTSRPGNLPEVDVESIAPLLAALRPAAADADDATWRKACVEDCLIYQDPSELRAFLAEVFTDEDAAKLDVATQDLWALRNTAVSN